MMDFPRDNTTPTRTLEDLERAVRALAVHFKADTVIIIGSQSVLLEWPDAPILMRTSDEIDAFPENAADWEDKTGLEASEEINVLIGQYSRFEETHGFFIDGVDETTAKLPVGWRDRAITREVDSHGVMVQAVAPSPHDLAVSKMHRLADKDRDYITERHKIRPLNLGQLREYFLESKPEGEILNRGLAFILKLAEAS